MSKVSRAIDDVIITIRALRVGLQKYGKTKTLKTPKSIPVNIWYITQLFFKISSSLTFVCPDIDVCDVLLESGTRWNV
jgi:hypothetical protein